MPVKDSTTIAFALHVSLACFVFGLTSRIRIALQEIMVHSSTKYILQGDKCSHIDIDTCLVYVSLLDLLPTERLHEQDSWRCYHLTEIIPKSFLKTCEVKTIYSPVRSYALFPLSFPDDTPLFWTSFYVPIFDLWVCKCNQFSASFTVNWRGKTEDNCVASVSVSLIASTGWFHCQTVFDRQHALLSINARIKKHSMDGKRRSIMTCWSPTKNTMRLGVIFLLRIYEIQYCYLVYIYWFVSFRTKFIPWPIWESNKTWRNPRHWGANCNTKKQNVTMVWPTSQGPVS